MMRETPCNNNIFSDYKSKSYLETMGMAQELFSVIETSELNVVLHNLNMQEDKYYQFKKSYQTLQLELELTNKIDTSSENYLQFNNILMDCYNALSLAAKELCDIEEKTSLSQTISTLNSPVFTQHSKKRIESNKSSLENVLPLVQSDVTPLSNKPFFIKPSLPFSEHRAASYLETMVMAKELFEKIKQGPDLHIMLDNLKMNEATYNKFKSVYIQLKTELSIYNKINIARKEYLEFNEQLMNCYYILAFAAGHFNSVFQVQPTCTSSSDFFVLKK